MYTKAALEFPTMFFILLLAACPSVVRSVDVVNGVVKSKSCNYHRAQQHFSLETAGLDGCHRLDSLTKIFGESSEAGLTNRYTATRFATANLVFVGRAVEYESEDSAKVELECYLKGRLALQTPLVTMKGLRQSLSVSVCRDSRLEIGQRAVYFATASPNAIGGIDIWLNENGFEANVNRTLAWLSCSENRDYSTLTGAGDNACSWKASPTTESRSAICSSVSVPTAMQLLTQLANNSDDLRPECRGVALHRPAFDPAVAAATAAVKSGSRTRASSSAVLSVLLAMVSSYSATIYKMFNC